MGAADLTRAFNDAFERRDISAIRSMLGDPVDYRTPELHTADPEAIVTRYRDVWARLPDVHGEIARLIESGDTVVVEVAIRSGDELVSENIAIHEWHDAKLVSYRMWRNPHLPAQSTAGPQGATPAERSRAAVEAVERRDVDRLRSCFAPRVDYETWDFKSTDREEVMRRYESVWLRFPDFRTELHRVLESGDTVVLELGLWNGQTQLADAIAVHDWRGSEIVRYRMWRNLTTAVGE